jgi:hypothetical protein
MGRSRWKTAAGSLSPKTFLPKRSSIVVPTISRSNSGASRHGRGSKASFAVWR